LFQPDELAHAPARPWPVLVRAGERLAIAKTAHLSARAAADELNRRGVRTARGKQWHAMQISRMRDRLGV
jgi:hypothetical protein